MSDLTLEEKQNYAVSKARETEAEKHFYDAAQPFFPSGFSIIRRNPGHWDIFAKQVPGKISAWLQAHPGSFTTAKDGDTERAFRIRGEHGNVLVMDERWNPYKTPREPLKFRSVTGAMLWIVEELMQEPKP